MAVDLDAEPGWGYVQRMNNQHAVKYEKAYRRQAWGFVSRTTPGLKVTRV
jgi:hypothetical protein